MNTSEIASAVAAERDRQRRIWGRDHPHGHGDCSSPSVPLMVKVAVLSEECGEVARAALDGDTANLRDELIQVMAVCHAILEGHES
jgi:hypothetical protein